MQQLIFYNIYSGELLDSDIQAASERIWAADANRFSDTDMTYNIAGPT